MIGRRVVKDEHSSLVAVDKDPSIVSAANTVVLATNRTARIFQFILYPSFKTGLFG